MSVSAASPPLPAQPADHRNPHADNLRFVLIALVVIGHGIGQMRGQSPLLNATYHFIYLFHVPAFVYLSGSFARSTFDYRQGLRWLATLIVPLLVFQAIYQAWDAWLLEHSFGYHVTVPYWLLWYLASLACWRLLLPPMLALRRPLLTACAVALLAGYADDIGYAFSLSRTLVFLPFFIAGHRHGLAVSGSRIIAAFAMSGLAVMAWLIRDISPLWLYGSAAYPGLWGAAWRGALLLAAAIGVWAILRLIPRHATRLSAMGRRSLPVYLVHGLVINAATALGLWASLRELAPAWRLGLAVSGGIALTCVLTRLAPWLRPIMDFSWLIGRAPDDHHLNNRAAPGQHDVGQKSAPDTVTRRRRTGAWPPAID